MDLPKSFYWNSPQYINMNQLELYPQRDRADCALIVPGVGFAFDAFVMHQPKEIRQRVPGYAFVHDGIDVIQYKYGTFLEPSLLAPVVTIQRQGVNQDLYYQFNASIPGSKIDTETVSGKPHHHEFRVDTRFSATGSLTDKWFSSQNAIMYNMLLHLMLYTLRQPGKGTAGREKWERFIDKPRIVIGPGIQMLRTKIVKEPKASTQGAGAPIYYQAGYVCFGYINAGKFPEF